MNRNRQEKGITLIALVITIIILLILAGVTINLVLGDNGLFNIAKEAAKNYTNAQERELAEIDNLLNGINKETNGEVENEDIPVYARLYTKNGTTNEVLILASSDNVFSDYSSELTLKQDFKNIYIYKPYTKEDLYEMTPYAEILN